MKVFADNMLPCTVIDVARGVDTAKVALSIGTAQINARVPTASIDEQGIEPGAKVTAVFDGARVQFVGDRGRMTHISEVNKLAGIIQAIEHHPERVRVTLKLNSGLCVVGDADETSLEVLGLQEDWAAVAIVKPEDVMIVTEG